MAYGARLESAFTARYRGFESLPLRQRFVEQFWSADLLLYIEHMKASTQDYKKQLMQIPGVGKSIAQDLINIGIYKISELKNQDPQKLYDQICDYQGAQIDRCLLYVMRGAVYFASHTKHDPEKLKWWNWMDNKLGKNLAK